MYKPKQRDSLSRYHTYLYTVEIKSVFHDAEGRKIVKWRQEQVEGCSMTDVAGKLKQELDNVRYVNKTILA